MAERTLVRDITKLETGQVILVNTRTTSRIMTVKVTYDQPKEGKFAVLGPGVQCTVHRPYGQPDDVLITESSARGGSQIYLIDPEEQEAVKQKATEDANRIMDELTRDPRASRNSSTGS